jgi:hypothetical protein
MLPAGPTTWFPAQYLLSLRLGPPREFLSAPTHLLSPFLLCASVSYQWDPRSSALPFTTSTLARVNPTFQALFRGPDALFHCARDRPVGSISLS